MNQGCHALADLRTSPKSLVERYFHPQQWSSLPSATCAVLINERDRKLYKISRPDRVWTRNRVSLGHLREEELKNERGVGPPDSNGVECGAPTPLSFFSSSSLRCPRLTRFLVQTRSGRLILYSFLSRSFMRTAHVADGSLDHCCGWKYLSTNDFGDVLKSANAWQP